MKIDSDYGHGFNLSEYDKTRAFMKEEREKKRWIKNAVLWMPRLWWRGVIGFINLF